MNGNIEERTMKIYHVETKEDYDALMIELEEKGYRWLSGYKPTEFYYWERNKVNSYINILDKDIGFINIEQSKKKYPDTPIIEYKAKGENMTQEEMKYNLQEIEPALQEAKSAAKKLIEKIDEYLENLKPKFKVGDYVTVYVNSKRKTAKIEKIDELVENNSKVHGLWYDRTLVNFKQDYWFSLGLNDFRHARPTEIAEYEVALTFHKHGRKPFEVKEGDILKDNKGNILINDENILRDGFPKNLKKNYFTSGRYTFLKTAEEANEWLENK